MGFSFGLGTVPSFLPVIFTPLFVGLFAILGVHGVSARRIVCTLYIISFSLLLCHLQPDFSFSPSSIHSRKCTSVSCWFCVHMLRRIVSFFASAFVRYSPPFRNS
ncbi:hypothetical protein P154DRAFT_35120 [Amniculicola lignicola CBS 123094]|uniref:Uncharacterized protein n=1 Tax=Amniculicola lignicola CBS 123094 TaxID=1392246 RepID=A0A6A5WV53_9PLEO|nr:hypothetical protein P154DRAFT_35120 [Amniculicola lignicola CBS 123094]